MPLQCNWENPSLISHDFMLNNFFSLFFLKSYVYQFKTVLMNTGSVGQFKASTSFITQMHFIWESQAPTQRDAKLWEPRSLSITAGTKLRICVRDLTYFLQNKIFSNSSTKWQPGVRDVLRCIKCKSCQCSADTITQTSELLATQKPPGCSAVSARSLQEFIIKAPVFLSVINFTPCFKFTYIQKKRTVTNFMVVSRKNRKKLK